LTWWESSGAYAHDVDLHTDKSRRHLIVLFCFGTSDSQWVIEELLLCLYFLLVLQILFLICLALAIVRLLLELDLSRSSTACRLSSHEVLSVFEPAFPFIGHAFTSAAAFTVGLGLTQVLPPPCPFGLLKSPAVVSTQSVHLTEHKSRVAKQGIF
jgi:hypothetical protein